MKKILNWLIYSSENPENFSLTIKGILVTNAVLVLGALKLVVGVEIPQEQYIELVGFAAGTLGLLMASVGVLRKFWNLAKSLKQK